MKNQYNQHERQVPKDGIRFCGGKGGERGGGGKSQNNSMFLSTY
jgi:hypothetical protein